MDKQSAMLEMYEAFKTINSDNPFVNVSHPNKSTVRVYACWFSSENNIKLSVRGNKPNFQVGLTGHAWMIDHSSTARKELTKLKKVGDSCILSGNIKSLRSCVCRYQKKSNLFLSNKVIDDKLHVIVIKEK